MTFETYKTFRFSAATRRIIEQANEIIEEYDDQGYSLTLRQLYYQFVSRDIIENTMQSYKRLGSIITDGRLAGEISWRAIDDNHRTTATSAYVQEDETSVLAGLEYGLSLDFWARQDTYIEVWVEKDALLDVVKKACNPWDVPHMACKGYMSASEAWRAGKRFLEQNENGKDCVLIHLGDHDPSGIDMTRDNADRLEMFAGEGIVDVRRIALNMDQVKTHRPPPNPAKITDSRAENYIAKFGNKSWELDALKPQVIHKLITDELRGLIDQRVWDETENEQDEKRRILASVHEHWESEVRPFIERLIEE